MKELDFAFYSDVGGRANNEDSYLAKRMSDGYLFIVADGLGGHEDGAIASRMAVDVIKERMLSNDACDVGDAIKFANEQILYQQNCSFSKMKTTIAVVCVKENETIIAHVGDTRIYAFNKNEIVFQSQDHSMAQHAVNVGEIEVSDIRKHEDRNVLVRALGAAEAVKADITRLVNGTFDALLLCSDGFWEYVLEKDMESTLKDSKTAEKWLYKMRGIQLKAAPKQCDNNTAIAVMV